MTDLLIFAENIRYYRKRAALTQMQLADKLGYDKSSIAKIETGKVDVPYSKLIGLAKALGCSPLDLLPSTKDNPLSSLEKEIIRKYRQLSITEQNMILRMLGLEEKRDAENVC